MELLPVGLLAGLALFVLTNATRDSRARQRRSDAALVARDTTLSSGGVVHGTARRALVPAGARQVVPPEELRRRVANLSPGTYVGDILAEQDSALYHWPERLDNALRVYVEPTSSVPGFDRGAPQMARAVFDEWSEAGFPLRFVFIYDTASADITIRWLDRFPPNEGQRIGVTERTHTSEFLIAAAKVGVALHDSAGRPLSGTTIAGTVRHEVGHALGLNHAEDPSSVMYRESATTTIGASDRATLRLLYLVPPGSLKD